MEAHRLREAPRLGFLADTSFLLLLAEARRSFVEQLEALLPGLRLLIIEPVLEELRALEARGGRRALRARLALSFAQGLPRMASDPGEADEALLATARRLRLGIASLDEGLIARARALGLPVLRARAGRPLLEGFLP